VREGYRTGRGKVVMRAKCHFEDIDRGQRQAIIVDEIPYQVNKKNLLERMAELVHEKKLEGISHIQDESDKSGMRVVIELKRGEVPEVVLNNLYKQTQLQDTFGINMVALIDNQPKLCNLKDLIEIFLEHRARWSRAARCSSCARRASAATCSKAWRWRWPTSTSSSRPSRLAHAAGRQGRADEQELGLVAGARDARARRGRGARAGASRFRPRAAAATTACRPTACIACRRAGQRDPADAPAAPHRPGAGQDHRRVQGGDDRDRRPAEHPGHAGTRDTIISDELAAIKTEFGQTKLGARRSVIEHNAQDLGTEDLITPTDMVGHALAHRLHQEPAAGEYRAQRRGGRGKQATQTKEDDWVDQLFIANTHD
jgi:DNA gyrase subunit A